ncbi:UDP-glucuronosyltransferase 2C1-like isoform X2 [Clupea harengus]|nr:UDP-glucuronosyltransferase 2C1-like isoform X2 [Clupea harengus]XP_031420764.1 UDP-glucuronosyltransferase 2C1-like isoform X2 [Clupea harengus]
MAPTCPGLLLLVLLVCGLQHHVHSGQVLVIPGEYSHWQNMRVILEGLVERNHSVTVLVSTASPTVNFTRTERFHLKRFSVPMQKDDMNAFWDDFVNFWKYQRIGTGQQVLAKSMDMVASFKSYISVMCKGLLGNETLLEELRRSKYEVILTDPFTPCGDLVADALDVPFIIVLRSTFGFILERMCGQMPTLPSFVPCNPITATDQMDFTERLFNFMNYFMHSAMFLLNMSRHFDNVYSEIRGKPTSMCDIMGKADLWFVRSHWDWDYPRPFPPNFIFIGGHHCKPSKPLPADLEEFVQSSDDDGIVVFSFGSLYKNLTVERRDMFVSALGQIPQKVVWGFAGERPQTLPANIRIYNWIPQNDLLGHPKTKAFITHGGSNGLYEAIYHGVPLVGIPLFADQPDNIFILEKKGVAVNLDLYHMDSDDLVEGLRTVINNPLYKENIMSLSRLHHDQPMRPLDRAVFWTEFVMRNKGAKHLRVQSHDLNWVQYFCLDVALFLSSVAMLFSWLTFQACGLCIRKCCWKKHWKRKND